MSKVFQSIINNFLISNLERSSLLSDVQYGFHSSRSTADILTVITERISRSLDLSFQPRSIALDISKAFDKVWRKELLHKLQSYGITGKILAVIKSFLSNRKMKVVLDGQSSQFYSLKCWCSSRVRFRTNSFSHLYKRPSWQHPYFLHRHICWRFCHLFILDFNSELRFNRPKLVHRSDICREMGREVARFI